MSFTLRRLRFLPPALVLALLVAGVAAPASAAPPPPAPPPGHSSHEHAAHRNAAAVVEAAAAPPTAEFEKIKLDGGLSMGEPMELAVMPNGNVMYINRGSTQNGAQVRMYDAGTSYTGTVLTLQVDARHEDGGLGITLHPQFATNNWVFIFYSPKVTPLVNRISRFTYDPAAKTIDPASEDTIIEWATERELCCHSAGSMSWDSDNNLYFATGDNTNSWESGGMAPIDERTDRNPQYDAQRTSANTNDLRGKINRIHPESNGTYTIPSGNLFVDSDPKTRPEIYVMGVRNPFRIWVDTKANNTLYWGEVGPDAGEDSATRGPAAYDEFNRATGPGNYGWPYCGGPNVAYNDWDFAANGPRGWFPCGGSTGPVNDSPRNTGIQQLPPTKPALVWEQHGGSDDWPALDNPGGCGSPNHTEVYHYDANLQSDVKWPQYYDNKWLISEYCRNWIKEVQFSNGNPATGTPTAIEPVLPGFSFVHPMDFQFGPDGAMYLLEYGSGWFSGASDAGLYRIIYNAGGKSPVAKASADKDNGTAPLTVAFSSAGSNDPEGTTLTYAWDFDGNGSTDSTAANPSHTYTANGSYNAKLTVTDGTGKTGSTTVPIVVGNNRATLSISGIPDGGVFAWGDDVTLSASGSDPEDGTIPCGDITLKAALGHEDHAHEIGSGSGCGATFDTGSLQEPPDQKVFFILRAVYTDDGATGSAPLTAEKTVVIWPKRWQAEHSEQLNGTAVINSTTAEGGKRIGSVEHDTWVRYHPVSLKGVNQVKVRVSAGDAGGDISFRLGSPTGTEVARVAVPNTGGWDTYQEKTVTVTKPNDSTNDLYLVFTNSGAGTRSLLDVDWFEFIGPGVGAGTPVGPVVGVGDKCLDISSSQTADGTKIQLWTCNGTGAQQWTIGSDGTLRALGKCLDVKSSGTTNGTPVHLWTCNGTGAQVWSSQTDGTLKNPQSGRCLDVTGGSTADGTPLQIYDCTAAVNQRWTLPGSAAAQAAARAAAGLPKTGLPRAGQTSPSHARPPAAPSKAPASPKPTAPRQRFLGD